jgi:hypothetical protein
LLGRKIFRRRILRPEDSLLRVFFARSILRLEFSSPDNSSLEKNSFNNTKFLRIIPSHPSFREKNSAFGKKLLGDDSLVKNYTGEEYSGEE